MVRKRSYLWCLLAVVYVAMDLFKPLHVDDGAYVYFARQMARHPLDPYGFWLQWYDYPQPANEVLAPPVLPATWGLALALGGQRGTWTAKLILLPWALLLAAAVNALARRFARPLEGPVLVLVLLSPALLPSLNFMLDVPELALGLAAVEVFLQACGRRSWGRAAVAGLLAGLAMQTKYTGFIVPGVMLVAALTWRRLALWPIAALVAVQVFATWELLIALLYGESHFLLHVRDNETIWLDKLALIPCLLGNLGGLLPAVFVLALAALRVRASAVLLAAAVVAGGYLLLVVCPTRITSRLEITSQINGESVLSAIVFGLFAGGGLAAITVLVYQHLQGTDAGRRRTLFLLGWLGMEVMGYLALTPFPAVRRVLGIVVVLTLLTARLAVPTCAAGTRRRWVDWIAAGGAILGLTYAAVDFREAQAEQEGVQSAAAWIKEHGGGRTWYLGHWGFQFATEQAGMQPVIFAYDPPEGPIPLPPPSQLRPGDWLVVPDPEPFRLHVPSMDLRRSPVRKETEVVLEDHLPLRTLWCFYSGGVPLEPHPHPRLVIRIYRVLVDFTPRPVSPESLGEEHGP